METAIAIFAHVLGLVGMAGIWLVPSRMLAAVAMWKRTAIVPGNTPSVVAACALFLAVAISAYIASDALPRVFRCLWEGWCTATRGGGLLNLAFFGLTVLLVEATWLVCRTVSSRRSDHAI